jgi:hypothetical protein
MTHWHDSGAPTGRPHRAFAIAAFGAVAVLLAVIAVRNWGQRELLKPDLRFPPVAADERFGTIAVGQALPSDPECAARVRRHGVEIRPENAPYNTVAAIPTAAPPDYPYLGRVTGAFSGTTDEIVQWTACKWGIDEDVVRAWAAYESGWRQDLLGDFGDDPAACLPGHPMGADGRKGRCPESVGILQVRYPALPGGILGASRSTAYNLDLALAVWRTCFDGGEPWLDRADKGEPYVPGDAWGCVGRWYAGRWHTKQAESYIEAVKDALDLRIWETVGFVRDT